MLLGHKRLPLSKYYRILNIRKNNNLSLYADGVTEVDINIKTSNDFYKKTLKINCNDSTLSFTNSDNVGSFVYTSDDNYIYVYFKPTYADRQIFIYSENDNIIAYFENDNTEYNIEDLTDYTEITNYVNLSGSTFVTSDITGRYSIKTINNDLISINMVLTVASDLTSGNRTLLSSLNLPSKTAFVIHGSTTSGNHISVQYDNNNNLKVPSSVGNITAGTYYVNGIIN